MKKKSVEQINPIDKEKDYSSYYEITDGGVIHFLKTWTNGKDFQDLEKELPIMLKQAHKEQNEFFDKIGKDEVDS